MEATDERRAVAAAIAIAAELGLDAEDADVLSNSNRLALRLLPCDTLARVAPPTHQAAVFEVDLARRLAGTDAPLGALEPRVAPRVYRRDGHLITFWTYYRPLGSAIASDAYAIGLEALHGAMREVEVPAPLFTDRVAEAERLVASRDRTPALGDGDRALLGSTLRSLTRTILDRGAAEQLLHGEPHPGNVLSTSSGPRFIDLETCSRGPIEFDLAHVPEAVSDRYPGVDRALLRDCRTLVLAMVATWRWDRDDQLPDRRALGIEWTAQVRAAGEDRQARTSAIAVDE
ncbi:MAG TPA: phosphotransferase [Candidatus Dormibacteraeota bacterium]|nr:phosphotransferase [Candidatus Dormibacteraeota bacterium]